MDYDEEQIKRIYKISKEKYNITDKESRLILEVFTDSQKEYLKFMFNKISIFEKIYFKDEFKNVDSTGKSIIQNNNVSLIINLCEKYNIELSHIETGFKQLENINKNKK